MKTVADFKRAMILGTVWKATHAFIGDNPSPTKDMGTRECGLANTANFAFFNPVTHSLSFCDWPKKAEFSYSDGVVTIEKEGFVKLTYEKVA